MRWKNRIFCRRETQREAHRSKRHRETPMKRERERERERGVHDAHQWQQGS